MTQKELVIKTISHQLEDGAVLPYQLDLTDDLITRLKGELGEEWFGTYNNCFAQERNESFEQVDEAHKKDMFGVIWQMDHGGDFGVVTNCMIPDANLDNYEFPKPDEKLIREKCERLASEKNKDKFKQYIIGFSMFERAWTLRGMTNILMDMIMNPEFLHALLRKITDYNKAVMDIVMEYDVDCIFFGDDWGQQKGLIMGPDYWRQFLKPYLKELYQYGKDHGKYICQHSCGDIMEVFPDLIEIGLDIYNTFQPEIYDIAKVKELYGDKLSFYGGISTQKVLPHGTAEEVKETIKETIKTMKKNGGYIIAPTHYTPDDVPTENIIAFLEVVQNQENL